MNTTVDGRIVPVTNASTLDVKMDFKTECGKGGHVWIGNEDARVYWTASRASLDGIMGSR